MVRVSVLGVLALVRVELLRPGRLHAQLYRTWRVAFWSPSNSKSRAKLAGSTAALSKRTLSVSSSVSLSTSAQKESGTTAISRSPE